MLRHSRSSDRQTDPQRQVVAPPVVSLASRAVQAYLDRTLQSPNGFVVDDNCKADGALRQLAGMRRCLWERQALVEAELLAWAEPLGLVRIEKAPAWKAIKARLIPAAPLPGAAAIDITTGELVPGVTLKDPAAELFHVRTE